MLGSSVATSSEIESNGHARWAPPPGVAGVAHGCPCVSSRRAVMANGESHRAAIRRFAMIVYFFGSRLGVIPSSLACFWREELMDQREATAEYIGKVLPFD